jgi:hypothetical protein
VYVATTVAAANDVDTVTGRHADLASADLVPDQHPVDVGDVNVDHILDAHPGHGIELVGPLPPDSGFKALDEHGFDFTRFAIDWDRKQVTCPNGKTSRTWRQTTACRSSRRPSVRPTAPLPGSRPLHPLTGPGPPSHLPAPHPVPDPTPAPRRAGHRRLAGPLRPPLRGGGHHRPSRRRGTVTMHA